MCSFGALLGWETHLAVSLALKACQAGASAGTYSIVFDNTDLLMEGVLNLNDFE